MRKYLYLFVAAAAMVLAGCQKETEQTINPVNAGKVTVLKASVAENNTKVSADAAGKFAWQAADAITAFDPEGNNLKFTTNAGGSATEFTFNGETALGSYALYPYNENHIVAGDDILVNLPAEYTYKADETNMPMLGKIENNAASFKAIGGVLKLIVYNIPESASKLTFTAANKQISGAFEIADASVDTPSPSIATVNTSKAAEKAVAINFTRSTNMVFYIPLPTGEIDGFTLAFNDSANTSKTVNASFTVGRNKIINAPALNLGSGSPVSNAVLSNADITGSSLTGSYTSANSPVTITNTFGDWIVSGMKGGNYKSSGNYYVQIRNNNSTVSYIKLPEFGNNIATVVLEGVCNNSESAYTGSIYFRTEAANNANNIASGASSTAHDDVTLTIPAGYKTGYIMSSGACLIRSITVTFSSGAPAITPSIIVDDESATIGAGQLSASINGVQLVNPIDGTGIAVSSDVDWLEAAITEGDYLGEGAKLTATAKSYNHGASARMATVTLKATGVTKTVTFKQNPSVVEAPTISTTAGNKTFIVTWTGDSKVESYVAYYASSELSDPSTGTALTISKNESTYSATPTETLTNGTTYYVYVKASSLVESYASKYVISDVWASGTVEPIGINGSVDSPVSMADAIGVINQLGDNGVTEDYYYVGGTVTVASPQLYNGGKLTFSFSDGTNVIKAYNCLNINGDEFLTKDDVAVGDEVVVYGHLEKYVKDGDGDITYEVVNGQLAKLTRATVKWVKTDITDLTTGDVVVIVDENTKKAMSNNNGTSSAPSATAVTLSSDKTELSATPATTLQWTITVNNGSYSFGVGDNKLYCTNSNNGVRVGTNSNNAFSFEKGFLKNTATSRWIGVYSSQDWRCYTSTDNDPSTINNIKATVTTFYKRTTSNN